MKVKGINKLYDVEIKRGIMKILNAKCALCGNASSYDKDSIKGDTYVVNGVKNIICTCCFDDLLRIVSKIYKLKIDADNRIYDKGKIIEVD